MKQYNFLQALYMSFYSRNLYRDVFANWRGEVVLYLFFVLFLCWVVLMIFIQPAINLFAANISSQYATQLPPMKIVNGVINTPEKKPYTIKDPDSNKIIAIIDTSGKYQTIENAPADILVTSNQIIYKENANEIKIQKIPSNVTADIEPKTVSEKINKYSHYTWILLFPILLLFSFFYRLIESLLYALLGKLFAAFSNLAITYGQVLKLTIVALTPVLVISTILDLLIAGFPFQWLFYFVISMAYLIFALGAVKQKG